MDIINKLNIISESTQHYNQKTNMLYWANPSQNKYNEIIIFIDDLKKITNIENKIMPENIYQIPIRYKEYDLSTNSRTNNLDYCIVITVQINLEKLKTNEEYAKKFFEKIAPSKIPKEKLFDISKIEDKTYLYKDNKTGNYIGTLNDITCNFETNERIASSINNLTKKLTKTL